MTGSIITAEVDFARKKRKVVFLDELVNQMQDLEESYPIFHQDKNFESMWKALKEVLKSQQQR